MKPTDIGDLLSFSYFFLLMDNCAASQVGHSLVSNGVSDGLVVERIDFSRLDDSSSGTDFLCECVDLAIARPAKKTFAPSRAKARATAPPMPLCCATACP